jgi:hypothetical protein
MTVNLDIISRSSHTTECLQYAVHLRWDVYCFVSWRRKQIFLYGTKCFQSTRFSISVRRCSVAIYCTGCTCHLKPAVLQGQIHLNHIQEGRYLYTAADRIQAAVVLYLKKLNSTLCWCGSILGVFGYFINVVILIYYWR